MAITVRGILKSPQGLAIQNAELLFEQTRTTEEVLQGTKFSINTQPDGAYTSTLGVGIFTFKIRFQEEMDYRTIASNIIVSPAMDNYSINQIIQDQSQMQDIDYDLLQAVLQARDTQVQQSDSAEASQALATLQAAQALSSQNSSTSSQSQAASYQQGQASSQVEQTTQQTIATSKAVQAAQSQTQSQEFSILADTKAEQQVASASTAQSSATTAQSWAANPENTPVQWGLYSALHYAAKAAQSAQTASGQLVWRGGWSAQNGNTPPTPIGLTQDFYRITQAGDILGVHYDIGDYIHWDTLNSIWFKMDGTDSVISVNGRAGAVIVTKLDVELDQVNNWGASSQTNDPSTTTYATTAGVKAAYDFANTKIGINKENILNNSDLGVGIITSVDSGRPWIGTYVGTATGDKIVSGTLQGGATIGAHSPDMSSWHDLYVNTSKLNGNEFKTYVGNPYAKLANGVSYKIYHEGFLPSAAELGVVPVYTIERTGASVSAVNILKVWADPGSGSCTLSFLIGGGSGFGGNNVPLYKVAVNTRGDTGSGAPEGRLAKVTSLEGSDTNELTFYLVRNGTWIEFWVERNNYSSQMSVIPLVNDNYGIQYEYPLTFANTAPISDGRTTLVVSTSYTSHKPPTANDVGAANRGFIVNGTDLNTYHTNEHVGIWGVLGGNNNGWPWNNVSPGSLLVESINNIAHQTASRGESFDTLKRWRNSVTGEWSAWVSVYNSNYRPAVDNWANFAETPLNVSGCLAWRNYGNSHVIFDASSGIAPTGEVIDRHNPKEAWVSAYPTLMGWNGNATYGVRVDSARVADTVRNNGIVANGNDSAWSIVNGNILEFGGFVICSNTIPQRVDFPFQLSTVFTIQITAYTEGTGRGGGAEANTVVDTIDNNGFTIHSGQAKSPCTFMWVAKGIKQ